MIKLEIRGIDEVQRKLAGMQRDMQAKVLQPAINKVADKARAEINRAIPQEFNVKASEVRNAIEVRKARSGKLEAVLTIFGSKSRRGRSLNMIHFLAAVQAARSAIDQLVTASQSATGALQAAQAGNQLLALQSQQLADLTATMASLSRAQSLDAAQRAAAQAQAREQMRRFLARGTGYQPGSARMFHD